MENINLPKRKRREPRAWICENGEKRPLVYVRRSPELSAAGKWMRDHPTSGGFTKAELRAILK
ncbi:hypothetical protein AGMMS4956_12600 [Bacteroidia bacterium]|nr:hypothetical protein AGMMS4956_12600 [Bacteroidia bacterium]